MAVRVDRVPAVADKAAAGARPADEIAADDLAVFRVGRVTSACVLSGSFTPPADFDLAAFWDRWSDSLLERYQVD